MARSHSSSVSFTSMVVLLAMAAFVQGARGACPDAELTMAAVNKARDLIGNTGVLQWSEQLEAQAQARADYLVSPQGCEAAVPESNEALFVGTSQDTTCLAAVDAWVINSSPSGKALLEADIDMVGCGMATSKARHVVVCYTAGQPAAAERRRLTETSLEESSDEESSHDTSTHDSGSDGSDNGGDGASDEVLSGEPPVAFEPPTPAGNAPPDDDYQMSPEEQQYLMDPVYRRTQKKLRKLLRY